MSRHADRQAAERTPRPVPAKVKRTRLGGAWVFLVLGAALLVLLLVFILMNSHRVEVNFYGAHVTAPLGIALLLAAALGVLLVVVPGGGRILQLKRAARRLHHEREHLAGRLDEITEATTPAPAAAQPAAAQPAPAQPAGAQAAAQPHAAAAHGQVDDPATFGMERGESEPAVAGATQTPSGQSYEQQQAQYGRQQSGDGRQRRGFWRRNR